MRKSMFSRGRVAALTIVSAAALLGAAPTAYRLPPRPASASVADAAQRGDLAAVRRLIAEKADVNAAQGDGMTALHWAAERGDLSIATVLLRAKADVKVVTRIGKYTPLHVASRTGSAGIVVALLKSGSDPNVLTETGATALHFAAASGSVESINALIDMKADVNARESQWGQTPLVFAAAADRGDVIRALLKRGADATIRTKVVNLSEDQARDQAASRKRNEALAAYMPKDSTKPSTPPAPLPPAADSTRPAEGRGGGRGGPAINVSKLTPTQVQKAIEVGREELFKAAAGPAREEADTADGQVAGFAGLVGALGGMTPLHHAVRQGNLSATVALLDGGAKINEITSGDSTTPLLLATINGQFDVALELIKRGADVNTPSMAGATPLYTTINTQWAPRSRFPQPQAVQNQKAGYLDVMEALLKAGAKPNTRLKTNLWYFAFNNCGNANCGLEQLEGTSPFWRAAYAVDVDAMRMLVKYGADPAIPSQRSQAAGGGRGGRGGGRGGRGGAADSAAAGRGGAALAQAGRAGGGGGGGGGGRGGGAPAIPLDPAIDSAARAVPPGIGVYAIHCAAGVGYGNGFAGNSHRHAPGGWMSAMKYLVEELHMDVNQRDLNGYTAMHHAAARGDNEMITYLVSKGGDVKAVARNGRTTVDMANGPVQRLSPIPETIALLEKLGAKNSHRCVSC
jgi:ankyrin repeat protein